jgi:hypothetical protein
MKKAFRQTLIFRVIFYIGATAVVLFVGQFQKHMTGNWIEPLVTNLDAGQSKELDAFLEMNRLITTLDTTLLGAMGFILANGRKTQRSGTTMWIAFASAFCVFLSLFFGYLVYLALLAMLKDQFFDLDYPAMLWASRAHFYTFLLGVVLFADFAFHDLQRGNTHESSRELARN